MLPKLHMSKYIQSETMKNNIQFFIDELYSKIPDWNEYSLTEVESLIDIVNAYPDFLSEGYEDKFQEIREEFVRQKQNNG